jgi:histidine triad (HIT) family protein
MPISHPDCPFCQIVGRDPEQEDTREIYRDDNVVAFFPTEPASLGHTLLIPRTHIPDIWSLGDRTAAVLAQATVMLSQAVKSALRPEGLSIIQSNGPAASQTVMHLHIHVVPRWSDDEIGPIWPPETNYSETEKDEAWEALRRECRSIMTRNGLPPR